MSCFLQTPTPPAGASSTPPAPARTEPLRTYALVVTTAAGRDLLDLVERAVDQAASIPDRVAALDDFVAHLETVAASSGPLSPSVVTGRPGQPSENNPAYTLLVSATVLLDRDYDTTTGERAELLSEARRSVVGIRRELVRTRR